MVEIIKSNQNKNIKLIRSLQQKKYREEYSQFVIEGEKLLIEALSYDAYLKLVAVAERYSGKEECSKLIEMCKARCISVVYVDDTLFDEISETETPQGAIAVVQKKEYFLDCIMAANDINIIVLDEIRDPGNLGTIIRTADACGLDAVILSKGCVDLYNSKSIRATMGSIFHIPIIDGQELDELIDLLHESDIETFAADPYGNTNVIQLPSTSRNAIFIGNESRGISKEIKHKLKHSVRIPMPGKAESLNAGIAAALMMYEITVRKGYGR
ncbi:MAG: TrmH family RNA methyltransferase [Bacillota bacterium]